MLDPRGRKEVLNVIRQLNAKGITTILITHFMEEAAEADQIIVMDNGTIKMDGTPPGGILPMDELKELNLGVPTAVELACALRNRGIDIPMDILTAEDIVAFLTEREAQHD